MLLLNAPTLLSMVAQSTRPTGSGDIAGDMLVSELSKTSFGRSWANRDSSPVAPSSRLTVCNDAQASYIVPT